MFLYKKCEVCGSKINKLQSIWNLYLIGYGRVLYCKNCMILESDLLNSQILGCANPMQYNNTSL